MSQSWCRQFTYLNYWSLLLLLLIIIILTCKIENYWNTFNSLTFSAVSYLALLQRHYNHQTEEK